MKQSSSTLHRDPGIDLLRSVCMAGVVMVHSVQTVVFACHAAPAEQWNAYLLAMSALRWPVLVFFVLSGVLFSKTISSKDLGHYYRRRMVKLVLPFVFWSLLYCWVRGTSNVTWTTDWNTVLAAASHMHLSMTYYHLWFMYDFILIAMAAPFIMMLKQRIALFGSPWFLAVAGGALFVGQYLYDFGHVGRIPVYVYYFYLGTFIRIRRVRYTWALLLLGIVGIAYNFMATRALIAETGNCDLVMTLMRYSFIQQFPMVLAALFLIGPVRFNDRRTAATVSALGSSCFGIYLAHPFFIWLFRLDKLDAYLARPPLAYGFMVFPLSFIAAQALTLVLKRFRPVAWLVP